MAIPSRQEPKYDVDEDGLFNRQSGEAIPHDEPVFILRARDVHALDVLDFYAGKVKNDHHRDVVNGRYSQFLRFKKTHPDCMKEPDTHASINLEHLGTKSNV